MKPGKINLQAAWLSAVVVCALLWAGSVQAQEEQEEKATLYERLGGTYAIAAVTDALVDRLYVNGLLNANPAVNEVHQRGEKPGFKFRVTAWVIQHTGGPGVYAGLSMREAHAHLNITEREFDAVITELVATLNKFNVPDREHEELLAVLMSYKSEIVMGSAD